MIWADRIAIGVWAILSMGICLIYLNGGIGPVPAEDR